MKISLYLIKAEIGEKWELHISHLNYIVEKQKHN